MDTIQKIISSEYNFPKLFSNCIEKEFGLLFYNDAIPVSHDANHAIITNFPDYDGAVKFIKEFYTSRNLSPRIYSSLINGQLAELTPSLEKHGFSIETFGQSKYMIHKRASRNSAPFSLEIKRVFEIDNQILQNVYEAEDIDRCRYIFEQSLKSDRYHLLVGYLNGTPVTTASIEFSQDGVGRMDSVETGEQYRGNGYARQITRFFVDYHYRHSDNLLYLYSDNPTAIRIYAENGFVECESSFESWRARIDV